MVREVPLETVLLLRGAVRDRRDKSKWHTERGPLSVTGPKFTNWHTHQGGLKSKNVVVCVEENSEEIIEVDSCDYTV